MTWFHAHHTQPLWMKKRVRVTKPSTCFCKTYPMDKIKSIHDISFVLWIGFGMHISKITANLIFKQNDKMFHVFVNCLLATENIRQKWTGVSCLHSNVFHTQKKQVKSFERHAISFSEIIKKSCLHFLLCFFSGENKKKSTEENWVLTIQ